MRYFNGRAVISVTPLLLEATPNFKISNHKTIISSLDLHFYDEVYEHLTMPEEFESNIPVMKTGWMLPGKTGIKCGDHKQGTT